MSEPRKEIYSETPAKPRGTYVTIKEVKYVQKEGEVKTTTTLEDKGECNLADINIGDSIVTLNYGQDIKVAYKEEKEGKVVKNEISYYIINSSQIIGKY